MFFPIPSSTDRKFRFPEIAPEVLLAFLYFLFLLPWLGKNRLLGLDESQYADMAWAAVKGGHWWPLFFHDRPFWDKPPLYFWLQGSAIEIFGKNEFAIRFWSAVAGGFSVYFVARLGSVLGNSQRVGLLCSVVLILQEHFLLYSRIGTLDMALLASLLGVWWHVTKAFNPASHLSADEDLLFAGLWMALGTAVKSWYGLVLAPAVLLALLFCRPWPFTAKQVLPRLFLPALSVMAIWMMASAITFGQPYLNWAWGFDIAKRFGAGGWSSQGNLQYHWDFYANIAQEGMAFLWPLVPVGMLLWVKEGWAQSARGRFDSTSVIGSTFFFYYLVFVLFFIATLINYALPLVPLSALSVAFFFRFAEERRVILSGTLALLLGLWNGLSGYEYLPWIVSGSFICCLILMFPAHWGPRRVWFNVLLLVWVLVMGVQAFRYLIQPPDPNRVWVMAVQTHPAQYPGQNLYFVGEETDARVLEFYSDYHICVLDRLPAAQPLDGALLFRDKDHAVYLPPPQSQPNDVL